MPYDPRTAPRYLDQAPDEDTMAKAIGVLERDLHLLGEAADTFQTTGWGHIAATLRAEIQRAKDELAVKRLGPEEIRGVQLQIQAYEYLLGMPGRVEQQRKMLQQRRDQIEWEWHGDATEEEIVEHPA